MAEMSRNFNFDDFQRQIDEALAEHGAKDARMVEEDEVWEEAERWAEHDTGKMPGEIGGVAIQLSFGDRMSRDPRLFDPDEAA